MHGQQKFRDGAHPMRRKLHLDVMHECLDWCETGKVSRSRSLSRPARSLSPSASSPVVRPSGGRLRRLRDDRRRRWDFSSEERCRWPDGGVRSSGLGLSLCGLRHVEG
jgi:hypothetical protein